MAEIIQEPNSLLRVLAREVPVPAITTPEIKTIIRDMKAALLKEDDGVALAAPQIGVPLRIFIVSKKALKEAADDMVFINPEIVRMGKQKKFVIEGCLSVRWKYGSVKRTLTATVRARNEEGNVFQMPGRGLLAQIFQHEIDHLNGILFIDTAKNIEDMPPGNHK